jgi:trehalose-6-phosphate synthase
MPLEERRERHRAMLHVLRRNDIAAWRNRFLDALVSTTRPRVLERRRSV